jgi:hypothetical protein
MHTFASVYGYTEMEKIWVVLRGVIVLRVCSPNVRFYLAAAVAFAASTFT